MTSAIRAVTFDYWGTLVWEDGGVLRDRRIALWTRVLDEAGFAVRPEALADAVEVSWTTYVGRWESNVQYGREDALHDILATLGIEPPPGVRTALAEVFATAHRGADLRFA